MKVIQIILHTALFFFIIGSSNSLAAEPKDKTETVVLLHGLGRTAKSMSYMEERLMSAGYTVYNYDYESRKNEISYLVDDLQEYLRSCCLGEGTSLHFVTHSLGGILVRALIGKIRPDNLGRVVMLSPPNKGSEAADFIKDYSLFTDILGPASMELGTDPESMPNKLGPADFELGIIAGDRTIDPISSWIIPGKDDGKVAVERTKLDGMTDFLVIPVSHAYIMQKPEVVDEVIHFLEQGKFSRSDLLPPPDEKK
jgi:triacylglycerol lipase